MKSDRSILLVTGSSDTITRVTRIISASPQSGDLTALSVSDALNILPVRRPGLLIMDIPTSPGPAYRQTALMISEMGIPCILLIASSGNVQGILSAAVTAIILVKPIIESRLLAALEASRHLMTRITHRNQSPAATGSTWEERYRLLFDTSRDGILILDGMTIVDCNRAVLRLFRIDSSTAIVGSAILNLLPPLQPGGIESRILITHAMSNTTRSGWSFMKLTVITADRQLVPTEMVMHGFTEGNSRRIQVVLRDISEQQNIEDRLSEGEEIARALVSTPTEPVLLMNTDGTIINLNHELSRRFGIRRSEGLGRPIYDFLDEETAAVRRRQVNTVVQTRMATRFEENIGSDWYDTVIYPVPDMNGIISRVAIFSRDITETRRMQQEIMEISELERKRIGQDLHDSLGQKLTGIAFLAQALCQTMTEKGYEEAADLQEIIDNVTDSIEQTRKISRGLWSIPAENIGIAEALGELASDTSSLFGIACRCTTRGEDMTASPSVIANLYYIARESINNAIRHGRARTIDISLSFNQDALTMAISDNGKGLAPGTTSDGIGLRIMNYRAGIIGGTFEAGNGPSGGFVVTVRVPGLSGESTP